MKLGLVGMPSSGKTTVLNAVTGAHGEVGLGRYHRGPEAGRAAVAARESGKLRLEGKEYPVQDGDIITFRFHV